MNGLRIYSALLAINWRSVCALAARAIFDCWMGGRTLNENKSTHTLNQLLCIRNCRCVGISLQLVFAPCVSHLYPVATCVCRGIFFLVPHVVLWMQPRLSGNDFAHFDLCLCQFQWQRTDKWTNINYREQSAVWISRYLWLWNESLSFKATKFKDACKGVFEKTCFFIFISFLVKIAPEFFCSDIWFGI